MFASALLNSEMEARVLKTGTLVALLLVGCWALDGHHGHETTPHYSNEWLVRLEGGPDVAELLALELGYVFLGSVMGFPDTYRMLKSDHPSLHKRAFPRLTQRLVRDARVVWAEQQFVKLRAKRDFIPPLDDSGVQTPAVRRKRADLEVPTQRVERLFNDELWDQEWYLQDTRTRPDLPKLDLHVLPLYKMGITGRGVRVAVLDDGIEYTHDDLQGNYDSEISYDVNDGDSDPTPRYDEALTNAHGTRCAGEIAMSANNRKCGVGVAFNAKIGGIRLLDGMVNDRVEGTALGHAYDKVDIYSASWGPNDDGKTVEGPGRLAQEAIERGIQQGRGGKGCVFVWASGNGGSKGDNCNCDGYIGSVYTLSIGSASQQGQFPWYGERCASTMAATYSSGAYSDQMIATTDLRNTCTIKHTGTSASAPLAAGIIALALEVNPELTWRDVQHLVMWTAEYAPLSDNSGWQRNAAGAWINTRFGFGLMNAHGLVTVAANWTTVPPKTICTVSAEPLKNATIVHGVKSEVVFNTDGCAGTGKEIKFLEHVEVVTNVAYTLRGALEMQLTSPAGTGIQLLSPRQRDQSDKGFEDWKFMSVLSWGEQPSGTWILDIIDEVGPESNRGTLASFTLILHGTKARPAYLDNGPRRYNQDYNRVHKKVSVFKILVFRDQFPAFCLRV
ncbi:neuroendocrine convertase 1-like isoform X2 [Zootermopsis nevadensis]|uniref:neuroendocrine convertase 1-like isoform X2 n=1 Tax=Zootermopsis nevadensis TaxID=136037 RepID=UPI000B8E31FA|nr:neuroendocrine convertase 1-like isoform X2 [Zootermopsis nevadensis]